jgi:hypothetical protein
VEHVIRQDSPESKSSKGQHITGAAPGGQRKHTRQPVEPPGGRQARPWLAQQVHEWRAAVGDRGQIDREGLDEALAKLEVAGLPQGLAAYVVLGCEWLFRLRDFAAQDVGRFLRHLQAALEPVMGADEAEVVTKALEPGVRNQLRSHRQLAAALEWERPKVFPFGSNLKGVEGGVPTKPLIPIRPGPAPKLAPWIAGLIVERLLEARGPRRPALALGLTEALKGAPVDEKSFRTRRSSLSTAVLEPVEKTTDPVEKESALGRLVTDFVHRYEVIGSLERPRPAQWLWPEEWDQVIRYQMEIVGPSGTFPFNLEVVRALYSVHRSSPRGAPERRPRDT